MPGKREPDYFSNCQWQEVEDDMTESAPDITAERTDKFDVFISYSHDDERIAERLSKRIRRYKTPRGVKRRGRPLVVFRDVERLTAYSELSDALAERIEQAANMVVLCSPAAVASEYVDQEVKTFIENRGDASVILVLVDGDPENSFTPTISARYKEPLYIDLRPCPGYFRNRERFREGALRIIAALLGVDYADLTREDERRRNRLRWVSVLTVLAISLGLGSFYVADKVSADTWNQIRLPTDYYDNKLLPIKDYAVYVADPDIRLFLGYGAEHAAQYPEFPIALFGGGDAHFVEQTEAFLRNEKDFETLSRPVATLSFEIIDDISALTGSRSGNRSILGSGELRIFAHLTSPQDVVEFGGVMRYDQVQDDSTSTTFSFPPTQLNRQDPLGLRPWPTNVFNQLNLLPSWGYLEGNLKTAWDDQHQAISYEVLDVEESFWEGNDGQWIEKGVLTDGDEERQVVIAGNTQDLQDIDEEQWSEILEDPGWASYRKPERNQVEDLWVYRNRDGERVVRGGQVDEGILAHIESVSANDPELNYRVSRVSSQASSSTVELARVVAERYEEISGQVSVIDSYTMILNDPRDDWRLSQSPAIDASTDILDVFVIDSDPQAILVLTDSEGFFLSRDRGASWEDFNHGESALLDGSRLRTVVTGTPNGVYVLYIDPDSESSGNANNKLFRYARRSWLQRLRVGLISLLQAGQ